MRNKFVYSCGVKIHALGFDELLESIFCLLLTVEGFSLEKSCRDAWCGSWLVRGQVNMADEAKLHSPVHSTFEALVVQRVVGCCCGKNWALSVDQSQLWTLQFLVCLISLLSILHICNGFSRIKKAVLDQMVSRPPNSYRDLFLVHVWLWEVLWHFFVQPLSWSLPVVIYNPLFFTHHDPIEKWFLVA